MDEQSNINSINNVQLVIRLILETKTQSGGRVIRKQAINSLIEELKARSGHDYTTQEEWIDWILETGNHTKRQGIALRIVRKTLTKKNKSGYAEIYDLAQLYNDSDSD